MNWEAIGAMGEIAGALAVVASLLYVAGQIRQSNRLSASESGFAFIAESNRCLEWASTPEMIDLLAKLRSETELTPHEEIRTEIFVELLVNSWWGAETSYTNGIMDQDTYRTLTEDVKRYLATYPRLREYFRQLMNHFSGPSKMTIFLPIFENDESGAA